MEYLNNQTQIIDQILNSLHKIKSSWELLYHNPIIFNNIYWDLIIDNLIPLFRKDTFYEIVGKKKYYPQETQNCRYYIKPVDGSCGKGIKIVNTKPTFPIDNHIICPEIISQFEKIDGKNFKYDFRVWIGISSDLEYYICPTFIKRISLVPFNINETNGSLTNTALYSEQFDYEDLLLYNQINNIIKDILDYLIPIKNMDKKKHIMLTGWDFILNQQNEIFVLEVNCSPGINILHEQVIKEYLNWLIQLDKSN